MKVPFTHPHDSDLAGLRDYRAPLEPETPQRWPRWMAVITLVATFVGLAFALWGGVR
jgi:hypothetical protein